jgi:hypothetical protein
MIRKKIFLQTFEFTHRKSNPIQLERVALTISFVQNWEVEEVPNGSVLCRLI